MPAFLFLLFIGLIIRIILIGNTGFIADISFWKSWSLAAADHGIVWTVHNTNINYPPGFIYVLWLMGKLYSLIGNPHDFNDFWRENNFGFLFVSKSIAIVSDIIIAGLIYWFASQKEKLKQLGVIKFEARNTKQYQNSKDSGVANAPQNDVILANEVRPESNFNVPFWISHNLPLFLSAAFFLDPIVIIDSALWGQVESFGILFTLVAIILVFYKKPTLGTFFFTIGTLMKLQNIIFIPLYFLFIWRNSDLKSTVRSLTVAAFTFFLVNLPFIMAQNMDKVLYLLTVNGDYFPWMSLNAYNLWWIVAGARGMAVSDKITVLGILNAKTAGLILFSSFYLLSAILLYLKPTAKNLFLSLIFGIFAFFLFTTQSHERYSYPVVVLLLFLYPFLTSVNNSAKRLANSFTIRGVLSGHLGGVLLAHSIYYFWLLYSLLTIFIFLNIHSGLIANYPQNGFRMLSVFASPNFTILNSYILILLFLLLLPFIFSQISKWFAVLCSLFFVLSLTALNFSYIMKGKVSLTSFKPIIMKQDYGIMQVNKAINSAEGWKKWNRLSGNYFYYRKGFGTHANSNLVFDIDRKFTRFSTDYGIDTEAGTSASAVFQIHGDGKELFSSVKMGRFDFPKHIEVNVGGIKYLGLTVGDANDGINDDHADWWNPVLYK